MENETSTKEFYQYVMISLEMPMALWHHACSQRWHFLQARLSQSQVENHDELKTFISDRLCRLRSLYMQFDPVDVGRSWRWADLTLWASLDRLVSVSSGLFSIVVAMILRSLDSYPRCRARDA